MANSIFTFTSGNNIVSIENSNGVFTVSQKQGENDNSPLKFTRYTNSEAMDLARQLLGDENGEG